jgi:hypothetical protein
MVDIYQVQLRNGTAAQVDTFTGASGELTYDTDTGQLRVHDGSTVGGFKLAQAGGAANFSTITALRVGLSLMMQMQQHSGQRSGLARLPHRQQAPWQSQAARLTTW